MKKMKLELDKSLLKKARKERKESLQNSVAMEENAEAQQDLMGQDAEPKKKKLQINKKSRS